MTTAAQAVAARWWRSPETGIALLRRVVVLCGAMLVAWAVAAGTWRAWRSAGGEAGTAAVALGDEALRGAILGAPFYILGALGAAGLILLAAGLIGAAFGFLFGIPRMEPNVPQAARPVAEAARPAAEDRAPARDRAAAGATEAEPPATNGAAVTLRVPFRPSPALNEIADWLTKIIVGVGLVQARDIGAGFTGVMGMLLQSAGLERFPLAGVVVPCCMVAGLVAGFLIAYVLTTVVLGPELAEAADALDPERLLLKQRAEEERARARFAQEQAARAEEEARASARAEQAARAAEERARRIAEREQIIREWRPVDLQAILGGSTAAMPAVSPEAEAFAALDLDPAWSVDERQAWAKINTALGRPERAFEAYRAATEDE